MALAFRTKRRHDLLWLLTAATLQWLQPAHAAAIARDQPVQVSAESSQGVSLESMNLVNPVVTQGKTLLKALKGEGTSPDGDAGNSTWKFTGDVHLEFDGAVMDAQAATAVFVNHRLVSVVVQSTAPNLPKKLVHATLKTAVLDVDNATASLADGSIRTIQAVGAPAQFSYQLKKQARRITGHADRVDYDGVKDSIRFSGDTGYTDGNSEFTASALTYNFTDDTSGAVDVKSIIRPQQDRVPQPRTPDRASAK
jgi:lipopolysaccharide transport protein LptA